MRYYLKYTQIRVCEKSVIRACPFFLQNFKFIAVFGFWLLVLFISNMLIKRSYSLLKWINSTQVGRMKIKRKNLVFGYYLENILNTLVSFKEKKTLLIDKIIVIIYFDHVHYKRKYKHARLLFYILKYMNIKKNRLVHLYICVYI